ncbi:6720_t:CDS:2 [Entrophospora sp. SA101]|nr:8580_t:CDS:2 [Entrophospora sp. SA101]CAJ0768121.1 6720_t:CDS:2 [Entrophospora sp. SA101]
MGALTGFAYLVIFDAMGIFTIFISTVLITYRSLREPTIKNPFGVQRYEILFGFINILYLLFVALYILKEGLEHLLLETSEEHYDHNFVFPLYWVILALGVTLISAINYRNHKGFCISCPIATSLGKILLQTTPDSISMYLEDYLREANEQIVLKHVYQKLSPLLVNHNNGEKELKKLKLNNREDLMIRKPKSLYESAYGPGEGKYKGTNEIESTV